MKPEYIIKIYKEDDPDEIRYAELHKVKNDELTVGAPLNKDVMMKIFGILDDKKFGRKFMEEPYPPELLYSRHSFYTNVIIWLEKETYRYIKFKKGCEFDSGHYRVPATVFAVWQHKKMFAYIPDDPKIIQAKTKLYSHVMPNITQDAVCFGNVEIKPNIIRFEESGVYKTSEVIKHFSNLFWESEFTDEYMDDHKRAMLEHMKALKNFPYKRYFKKIKHSTDIINLNYRLL